MNPAPLIIFDDGHADLGPLTDLRPVFALRNGVKNNRERIEGALQQTADALVVPEELADLQRQRESDAAVNPGTLDAFTQADAVLVVNGRWTATDTALLDRIMSLPINHGIQQGNRVLAAHLDADHADAWLGRSTAEMPADVRFTDASDAALVSQPWHLLDHLENTLRFDLQQCGLPWADGDELATHGVTVVGDHPVMIHRGAALHPQVVINTTLGPVAIDEGAAVQPFTVIEGPGYVGPHAELAAHTALRAFTVVGANCKVGGEVKASILGDYTNKAHYGYLGNAVVGRWCNLGAGTTASNLKNTYGHVRMQLHADADPEDTGRQFQGPVVGDYVRTAIGTLLPTGACVGTGSCLVASGFVSKHVPAMTFLTDAGPGPMDLDAFFTTADRMMCRRNGTLSNAAKQRFRDLCG